MTSEKRKRDNSAKPNSEIPEINTIRDLIEFSLSYEGRDIKVSKIIDIIEPLDCLDKMIGMTKLKRSVVDLVLYYVQGFHRFSDEGDYLHTVICGGPGTGKCLGKGTPVRMYNNTIKPVEEVVVGDLLMGTERNTEPYEFSHSFYRTVNLSDKKLINTPPPINFNFGVKPRKVISIATGVEQLYLIKQDYANDYVVNESHILTLVLVKNPQLTKDGSIKYWSLNGVIMANLSKPNSEIALKLLPKKGTIIDISVKDYLTKSEEWKSGFRGFRECIYSEKQKEGIIEKINFLFDTHTNSTQNAIVSEETAKKYYELISSIGWTYTTTTTSNSQVEITIRKKSTSNINVIPIGVGQYYGFELDGNKRFLLGDYTVTHNTTVARIIGQIYAGLGILATDSFVQLKRTDFIGQYLGTTADKTLKTLTSCLHGVAFIDEAYSLAPKKGDNGDSFSKEAIDTLNQFLSEHKDDFVCIIAGYRQELDSTFFAMNAGLRRRFPWVFVVDDYTPEDLLQIFEKQVWEANWEIEEGAITSAFFKTNFKEFPNFGGDLETFFTKCKFAHVRRVFGKSNKEKGVLTKDDISEGFKKHLENKQRSEEPPMRMYL